MKTAKHTKVTKNSISAYDAAVNAKAIRLGWKPVEVSGTIHLKKELSKKTDIKTYIPSKDK